MAEKEKKFEPLRKITVKTVFGKIDIEELIAKFKGTTMPVMQVWGVVSRTKEGTSDYGSYVRFIGQFRAMNMQSGELFRAPVVLLPKFMEEEVAGAMAGGGKTAEFGFKLSAKYDKDAATKYVFIADPLIEPAETDQMSQLEARIGAAQKQLAAPKK